MPANSANPIANTEKLLMDNRSQVETKTAKTVISAAMTRRFVITDFAPPDNPSWSTQSEIAVWPAKDATVKRATHAIGTT